MTRKSNIIMGYDTRSWETTTGNHLSKTKSSIRDYGSDHFKESVNPGTKSVNWNLGTDKTDYSTSNFQRKPEVSKIVTAKLSKKDQAQLKNCHFSLGNDSIDYDWKRGESKLEEINRYTRIQSETNPVAVALEAAKKKNIILGYDNIESSSLAKSQFTDPALRKGYSALSSRQDKEHTKKFVKTLKTSAVCFGHDKPEYTRTNLLEDPRSYEGFTQNPPADTKQNKSSIVFGYTSNDYETQTASSYRRHK